MDPAAGFSRAALLGPTIRTYDSSEWTRLLGSHFRYAQGQRIGWHCAYYSVVLPAFGQVGPPTGGIARLARGDEKSTPPRDKQVQTIPILARAGRTRGSRRQGRTLGTVAPPTLEELGSKKGGCQGSGPPPARRSTGLLGGRKLYALPLPARQRASLGHDRRPGLAGPPRRDPSDLSQVYSEPRRHLGAGTRMRAATSAYRSTRRPADGP